MDLHNTEFRMAVKIMDLADFLGALVGQAQPEYVQKHRVWYNMVTDAVSQYAVELLTESGGDMQKFPAMNGPAVKQYEKICEMLLGQIPQRIDDGKRIEDLEDQCNTMAKVILHFMTKYPVLDNALTIDPDELNLSAKKFESLGVGECEAHGIHVDAIELGVRGKHAH